MRTLPGPDLRPWGLRHTAACGRGNGFGVDASQFPGRVGCQYGFGQQHDAQMRDWQQDWQAEGDPAVDAVRAMRVVSNHLGLDAATNPWITDERVDIEAFIGAMGRRT